MSVYEIFELLKGCECDLYGNIEYEPNGDIITWIYDGFNSNIMDDESLREISEVDRDFINDFFNDYNIESAMFTETSIENNMISMEIYFEFEF